MFLQKIKNKTNVGWLIFEIQKVFSLLKDVSTQIIILKFNDHIQHLFRANIILTKKHGHFNCQAYFENFLLDSQGNLKYLNA